MRKALFGFLMAATMATPAIAQEVSEMPERYQRRAAENQARYGGGERQRVERVERQRVERPVEQRIERRMERREDRSGAFSRGFGQSVQHAEPRQHVQHERVERAYPADMPQSYRRQWDRNAARAERTERDDSHRELHRDYRREHREVHRSNPTRREHREFHREVNRDHRQVHRGTHRDLHTDIRRDHDALHRSNPTRREHRQFHRGVSREHNGYHRQWDRDWRRDSRYDWQRYRFANRGIFSPGYYYSPYRNHRYNRFSIGVFLDQGFYSDRYWISNPWQYRLPQAYPGTQWVRYYDDVLLVDVYTGEVIDVIYNFFW